MKRTWLQHKTPLRKQGKSETAKIKVDIQAYLRQIVIVRDGGCILRNIRRCTDTVLQADHLISRSHSATYADSRLVVCVCRSCHAWKSLGNNLRKKEYDALVRTLLPKDRVALWDKAEANIWRPTRIDRHNWLLALAALKAELHRLQKERGIRSDGMPME